MDREVKTFVIGDIHGNYKALLQCLQRSHFDYEKDILISLGDIVDRKPESYECVEELLKIKNLIAIRGNHDEVFLKWIIEGEHPFHWTHGGKETAYSYIKYSDRQIDLYPYNEGFKTTLTSEDLPKSHIDFFKAQQSYYIDDQNRLFIHGGFNRHHSLSNEIYNNDSIFLWDRDLWNSALSFSNMRDSKYKFKIKDNFKEVFIGHTPTINWNIDIPMNAANIWNLDTGAAYDGKLTIMNVDTKEYWQSDKATELYPNQN